MIRTVACTSCATTFPVDPRKVPEDGVYARCSACSAVFFVEKGDPVGARAEAASAAGDFGGAATMAPPAPAAVEEPDAWVFERDPDIAPGSVAVDRIETVEEAPRHEPPQREAPAPPPPEPVRAAPPPPPAPEPVHPAPPPFEAPPVPRAPEPPKPAPAAAPAAAKPAFTFGRRDPHEKASRLARVLVSDIITYNPERHQRALDGGTLKADFEEEVKKSWGEYVDQVGRDIAESTDYFSKALNEILARGQQIF